MGKLHLARTDLWITNLGSDGDSDRQLTFLWRGVFWESKERQDLKLKSEREN